MNEQKEKKIWKSVEIGDFILVNINENFFEKDFFFIHNWSIVAVTGETILTKEPRNNIKKQRVQTAYKKQCHEEIKNKKKKRTGWMRLRNWTSYVWILHRILQDFSFKFFSLFFYICIFCVFMHSLLLFNPCHYVHVCIVLFVACIVIVIFRVLLYCSLLSVFSLSFSCLFLSFNLRLKSPSCHLYC